MFTKEDIEACWERHVYVLRDILNGEMSLDQARKELRDLIGTVGDSRRKQWN